MVPFFVCIGTLEKRLVSGSRAGPSRFTARMPLPVTVHVVHRDVADWTVGRVLFLEDYG